MPGDKVFFDTNILLYLASEDQAKALKAEKLLEDGGIVSVQVLNEFAAVSRRKRRGWAVIHDMLAIIRQGCQVVSLTVEIQKEGLAIAERHGFSIYDSMILAAAEIAGCETLYSEDFQHRQSVGRVTIVNPFVSD